MWSLLRRALEGKPKNQEKQKLRKNGKVWEEFGPPLTPQELRGNLSELQDKLNAEMQCHAGREQVFIRSLLTGTGTTQPRLILQCSLRRDIGQKPTVFYEHIRDVCCRDPEQCEAYRAFKERFVET